MAQQEPKKEMLSISQTAEGKPLVRMNYSSLSIIQTCMQKADYALAQDLRSSGSSPATCFGSAIHKALEEWYLSDLKERIIPPKLGEKLELEVFGHEQGDLPVFRAAREFRKAAQPLWNMPETDKRSLHNGAKILTGYFKTYKDDGLTVVSDEQGPIVEREVRFQLAETPHFMLEYFGTIDAVLENRATGVVAVVDHKTTSQLGSQFYNRIKPNHQYTGYILGAKKCLSIDTSTFMVNGIQVAKTKQQFARQFTDRTEEDFTNLKATALDCAQRYLAARAAGVWPQAAPDPCTNWGGCQFLKLCEVPKKLRPSIIRATWGI